MGSTLQSADTPVVAIDGPSGSGKGIVCRRLAQRLGWHLLDSGALYRLVAVSGQMAGVPPDDVASHVALARSMEVVFGAHLDGEERIELFGKDVTRLIRAEEAGQGASRVAAWPELRSALKGRQRAFARPPGLIADGRDMGTVIFVDAPLKIFLTASAEERALRRYKQLKDKDSGVSLAALSREIAERDLRDSSRSVAPLRPASDAFVIDSTGVPVDQIVERVIELGRSCALWR
ncbi:MAG: (d)CMP kinase [Gammaproteobacteria bacterium]|nr:(d)CMP kinase [Gammaproteobacteria bacterium]